MTSIKSDSVEYKTNILNKLKKQGYVFNEGLLQQGLQSIVQALMDIEVSQILDASLYERSNTRRAYRNGYRSTVWDTPIGSINLRIPKLRRGSYYPERLLNDEAVVNSLIRLVKLVVIYGIDEPTIADILSQLGFVLSSYEVHQICDGLSIQLDQSNYISDVIEVDVLPDRQLSLNYQKYLLLMRQRNADGQLEIVNVEKTNRLDREFWQDFTRRLSQSGVIVDNPQSVLSSINPYAQLQLDDVQSAFRPDFVVYIHEYQLIA